MGYATAQDMRARFQDRLLAHITDPAGHVVQEAFLDAALADASALADVYLGGRYCLPLSPVPAPLVGHVCNIALYDMLKLRPAGDLEDARARYRDAVRFLEEVRDGKLALGSAAAGATSAEPGGALVSASPRVWTRQTLADY